MSTRWARPVAGPSLVLAASLLGCVEAESVVPSRQRLRGRWEREGPLRVFVADGDEAASRTAGLGVERGCEPLQGPVRAACELWNRSSPLRLEITDDAAAADVTVSWERGAHGPCPPFGVDPSVAHAGPLEPGTYLHLDAERPWGAPGGPDLGQALAHELGHLLGLDHSAEASDLMHADPTATEPTGADVDAIHTLYGGGVLDGADLVITREGERVSVLHGVAPEDRVEFGLLDVEGDGTDELVLWRTDFDRATAAEGAGDLIVFHFGRDAQPHRTSGPFLALVVPGAAVDLIDSPGVGRLRQRMSDGASHTLGFRRGGDGLEREDAATFEGLGAQPHRLEGDLDGDGRLERVGRVGPARRGERDVR